MKATAPAEAAFWEYDLSEGIWREAGKARRMGDFYFCSLSKAGFFCIADALPAVYVHLKLVDNKNNPYIFTAATLQLQTQDASKIWPVGVYTNNTGELSAYVPANVNWSVSVKDECGTVSAPKDMLPLKQSLWKTVVVDVPSGNQTTVEGKAFSCEKEPMKSGSVIIRHRWFQYVFPVKDGKYSFKMPACPDAGNSTYEYSIHDSISKQSSEFRAFTLNRGGITTLPDIEVCNVLIKKVKGELVYTTDGKTYTLDGDHYDLAIISQIDPLSQKRLTAFAVLNTDISTSYLGEKAGTFKIYVTGFKLPATPSYFLTWGLYEPGTITVDELDVRKGIMKGSFTTTVNRNYSLDNPNEWTTLSCKFNLHL